MVVTTGSDGITPREGWSSRSAFILAAVGSAVGLGNMWRFPAEAGENGGGAFVLFYILCVVLIGLPVLLSEVLIGRHGQSNAPESVKRIAAESGKSGGWAILADIGVLGAFMVLSFYCVVGGWVLYYIGVFANDLVATGLSGGAFQGRPAEEVEGLLPNLFGNNVLMVGLHVAFLAITLFFVARGVSSGIEWVATWLMPLFFVLFLAITIYGATTGGFSEAMTYLFTFDFSRLTGPVMLAAVGQAFFSLSLGVAGMMTYGAYVGRDVNLASTSGIIAGADTAVALLAGLCIFPIVFAAGLEANAGPGLMFQSLPIAFRDMPFGSLIGLLFFIMVFFAALTSSVSLLEAPTAWFKDRAKLPRAVATTIVGGSALVLGALAAWFWGTPVAGVSSFGLFDGQDLFNVLDTLTSKLLMPIGAILTSVFVGWVASRRLIDSENGLSGGLQQFWLVLVRWFCPLMLTIILVGGIFPEGTEAVFALFSG
ncbi:MAG: sodium-dependent transporter [Erythrobacter sp.]|jgi:NSS family neurotransmitter:Na+ symporter|nr:sodium-dependent transporter [Erythrobacter sp.]